MSIIYNGVTLTDIKYNGVSLDKVIYNGVTVFEKAPAIIREPASGEYYQIGSIYQCSKIKFYPYFNRFFWAGSKKFESKGNETSYNDGIWTYYRGSIQTDDSNGTSYGIYRIKN